ncbi:hypothetical protein HU200_038651 [Digitaria exilis]|uniref:RING-type domain-containing protein n=1 Tax=Digitaria exilis TaxID=1010633 RepID=A0A835EFR4_9POAL|nr:hypothetical protein HU200_038651 [Digitaria exilis]CAB3449902.1 unnamed protein product [Digitaria exilis]
MLVLVRRPSLSFRPSPMAVHAQYLAHAFPHDHRGVTTRFASRSHVMRSAPPIYPSSLKPPRGHDVHLCLRCVSHRPALDILTGAPVFRGDHGCGDTVFSDPFNNDDDDDDDLGPGMRARVGDVAGAGLIMDLGGQRALLPPPVPVPQAFAPAGDVHQMSRVLCSCGRTAGAAPVSQCLLLLPHLYRTGVEIDALVRIEVSRRLIPCRSSVVGNAVPFLFWVLSQAIRCLILPLVVVGFWAQTERLRAELQEARRRHARAVASAVEREAARRLQAAEGDLELALARNAELEERLRETVAEGQAWQGVAKGHEDVAAGLRATLDGLTTRPPRAEGEGEGGGAEDARSCCFEREGDAGDEACCHRATACRSCGEADACVLLLLWRHLCVCGGCGVTVGACPVCAATKNASLRVLLS